MPKSLCSEEFKSEAIRHILENGLGLLEVSKAIRVSEVTLYKWLKTALWKSGDSREKRKLSETGKEQTSQKSELENVKMERDILNKAAAYIAAESQ